MPTPVRASPHAIRAAKFTTILTTKARRCPSVLTVQCVRVSLCWFAFLCVCVCPAAPPQASVNGYLDVTITGVNIPMMPFQVIDVEIA